jgi:hypothetical protein
MSQTPAGASPELQDLRAKAAKYEHAIHEMEKHLRTEVGAIVLEIKSGPEIGVDHDTFDELSKSLQQANEHLRSGKLHPSQVGMRTTFGGPAQSAEPRVTAAGSCPGVDRTSYYWWGYKLQVNQCVTNEIEGILQGYQGTAGIAAAIAGVLTPIFPWLAAWALMGAITAGIAGLYQGAIQWTDQACGNQGIAFDFTWVSPFPWLTCS